MTDKQIQKRIEKMKTQYANDPAKLKCVLAYEQGLKCYPVQEDRERIFKECESILKNWKPNPLHNEALSPECKQFAELVVSKIGAVVGELREEAKKLELDEATTRKTLLLAFQILGDKAGLAYRSLVQKLRRNL